MTEEKYIGAPGDPVQDRKDAEKEKRKKIKNPRKKDK